MLHGIAVEVVHHPAFATRGSALHLLSRATNIHVDDGFAVITLRLLKHGLAGCFFYRHQRPTEGPARTTVHIHLDAQWLGNILHVLQRLHPFWGEERDVVLLVALHAIERCYLHRPDACLGILRQIPLQSLTVYCRPQPPPACAGLGIRVGSRRTVFCGQLIVFRQSQQIAPCTIVLEIGHAGKGHWLSCRRVFACSLIPTQETIRM